MIATITFAVGGGLISSPAYFAKCVAAPEKVESVSMAAFGGGWGCVCVTVIFLLVTTLYGMFAD
jgi:hypothetical protein